MSRRVGALAVLLLCSCPDFGEDEPTSAWTDLPAAPVAVVSLSFDSRGTPVVFGGTRTFGEHHLQRPRASDGLWERAPGVPAGTFGDRVFRVGDRLYALLGTRLLRLDDETTFTWSTVELPPVPDNGRLAGLAADESVFYATTSRLADNRVHAAIVAWAPGEPTWVDVPAAYHEGDVWGIVVHRDGDVIYSVNDGIFRGDRGGVERLADCNTPELRYCEEQISRLVVDDAGNVTFAVCPYLGGVRALFRVSAAGGPMQKVGDIPEDRAYCQALQALPGGQVFLISAFDNLIGSDASLLRVSPGGSTLERVADGLDASYSHVVRDTSTLFRFADAAFRAGVAQRRF
jgi:hypothetical protein